MYGTRITTILVLLAVLAGNQPAHAQRGGGAAVNLPPMTGNVGA